MDSAPLVALLPRQSITAVSVHGDERMRSKHALLLGLGLLLLSGCGESSPACPPPTGTPEFLDFPPPTALPISALDLARDPVAVEIRGGTILVDQIVRGQLCNGAWSGTVYVTCDVQVLPWEELPTFLRDCDLDIAPDTVVYVADHYDAPYYNGCSCHTGEIAEP